MSVATSGSGGGGQIMIRVVDLNNPGETRPVWCLKDNCLHMAVLYPLVAKPVSAVSPNDIVAKARSSLVSYAIFNHPSQAPQYRQFCETVDIPRDVLTNKLANLPPQPTAPKVHLEKGMLVLAKGSKDTDFYPAEILEVSGNREKYHVQFIGARHLRGDKNNQCLLKQSDLMPLYQGSSLRAGKVGKEMRAYWPSRVELQPSSVKLGRAKKGSAPVAASDGPQKKPNRGRGRKSTATEGEVDTNPRPPKRGKTQIDSKKSSKRRRLSYDSDSEDDTFDAEANEDDQMRREVTNISDNMVQMEASQYRVFSADVTVQELREGGHPLCEYCAVPLLDEEFRSGKCEDHVGLEDRP